MGVYKISFNISPAPAVTNKYIAVLYKTTDPAAELARIVKNPPHTSPYNFVFPDLDAGVYIVKIHQSADGVTLGNLDHDFWVNSITNQILFERRFYEVDGGGLYDPTSTPPNNTKIVDPYFDGKVISGVFQVGYRYLKPGVEFQQNTGGELAFLTDSISLGQITNNPQMVWSVEIMFSQNPADVSTASPFSTIILEPANVTLDSTYDNAVILATSVGNKQTLTARAISTIPEGRGYEILHDSASAINVIFKAQITEVIRFRGADVNQVVLGKGESIKVIRKGAKLYVTKKDGQWDRVGERIGWNEDNKKNALLCDGTEYDLSVYVRFADYIAGLPSSQIVSYATFDTTATINGQAGVFTKRGFIALDSVNNKAKVPDMLNKSIRFLKNNGGADADRVDNIPGGYQHDNMRTHTVSITVDNTKRSNSDAGAGKFAVGGDASEGGDISLTGTYTGSADTHGINIGQFPFILI